MHWRMNTGKPEKEAWACAAASRSARRGFGIAVVLDIPVEDVFDVWLCGVGVGGDCETSCLIP